MLLRLKRMIRHSLRDLLQPHRWLRREQRGTQLATNNEILQYLMESVADNRRLLRYAIAENDFFRRFVGQTAGSFDFQWKLERLASSAALLSNRDFDSSVCDLVCAYSGLDRKWFSGKNVLDAGCGNGRFSIAMARMGANVTAFDVSEHGVAALKRRCAEDDLPVRVFAHDVLEPLSLHSEFHLVWSFGVLHHTGDTHRGFENIQRLVLPNGYMFLMLYGEPRPDHPEDFVELNNYQRLRRATVNRSHEEKIDILQNEPGVTDLHGWFDAVSPIINDLYTFEEIESWLIRAGFSSIRRTLDNRNHFVVARREF